MLVLSQRSGEAGGVRTSGLGAWPRALLTPARGYVRGQELQVRAGNVSARRFYGRMGYTEEALINGYYDGKEAAYQMKFRLAQ